MILLNFVSSRMNAVEYEEGMINLHWIATKYGYDRYDIVAETMTMMAAK